MQIMQFFCVMIGTFSGTIQNKRHFVLCEPTQISRIAAVTEPKQRGNLEKNVSIRDGLHTLCIYTLLQSSEKATYL
jgi:hypothetical protein